MMSSLPVTYQQEEQVLAEDPNPTSLDFTGENGAAKGQQEEYYSTNGIMISDPGNIHGGSNLLSGEAGVTVGAVTVNGTFSKMPACFGLTNVMYANGKVSGVANGPWFVLRVTQ